MAELLSFEPPTSDPYRLPPIHPCDTPRPNSQPTRQASRKTRQGKGPQDKGERKGKETADVTSLNLARTAATSDVSNEHGESILQ